MRTKVTALVWALAAVLLTLSLVFYPEAALESAKDGLTLFMTIVLPSLFVFFVLSEIMLALGVVHFIGVLFEPLMRPLFNVPGEGAFVLSMGLAAGYPMDAVITSRFRRQGMCSQAEAERMLAFSNTADPLFIFGAVAVGMFGMPLLGKTMAIAHYIAAFLVGIIFRFYRRGEANVQAERYEIRSNLSRAVDALVKAQREDGRTFGQLMGDAVTESIKTLWMICGFIMLFSTMVKMVDVIGLYPILSAPLVLVFKPLGIDQELVRATITGLFEIDLGTLAAAKAAAPLVQKVAIAGAIIAWSGLSVHGQVASVLMGTDIRMAPYAVARILHAALAFVVTLFLMRSGAGAAIGINPIMPVLGRLPANVTHPTFWELVWRGAAWPLGMTVGLMIVGMAVAAVVGGLSRLRSAERK
jgi:sporulation integral membrane protein YlbJ